MSVEYTSKKQTMCMESTKHLAQIKKAIWMVMNDKMRTWTFIYQYILKHIDMKTIDSQLSTYRP